MFFKGKKPIEKDEVLEEIKTVIDEEIAADDVETEEESPKESVSSSYAFYKPDPYPKELVSVLKSMLQRLFPDTRRAYLLEAQKSDQKGYLLIVDIDSKFLKIINIYLDGETKRVRGGIPIECILYSKSGSLTEGIDPFYAKETAQSKANNLASKEFSGDVVFSEMPEFDLWSNSDKEETPRLDGQPEPSPSDDEPKEEAAKGEDIAKSEDVQKEDAPKQQVKINVKDPVIIPVQKDDTPKDKSQAKVKPATKEELFGILNEYGAKKSGAVSTVAMAAIREYEFYIPYTLGKDVASENIDTTLPIDENLRFKKLINPEDETKAVPLFTQKEDALLFAKRDNCSIVCLKYKDFASSRAAEMTGFDGVLINPDAESIFLLSTHPLLG